MTRYRQLHLWITDHDYSLLRDLADERKETLSAFIRRLIKVQRYDPPFCDDRQPEVAPAFVEISAAELT